MSQMNSISPKQLSVISNAIALAISDDKNADELNVLGNVIVAVGSLLLTMAAQQQSIESMQNNSKNNTTGKGNKK